MAEARQEAERELERLSPKSQCHLPPATPLLSSSWLAVKLWEIAESYHLDVVGTWDHRLRQMWVAFPTPLPTTTTTHHMIRCLLRFSKTQRALLQPGCLPLGYVF